MLIAGRSPITPSIDQPDHHDRHRGAGLQHPRDQRAGEQPFDRRAGNLGQQHPHAVGRQVIDAVGHELQAEHENPQAANDGHENFFKDVNLHGNSPTIPLLRLLLR